MNLLALTKAIQVFLDGKKTYLTGIAAVCTGIANHDYNLVFIGLSAIFLRNGISKG
jgi:hypothetical protein